MLIIQLYYLNGGLNMNKLNIVQSSNSVETVTTRIIDQLYNAALSVPEPEEGETDQAYMSGHISVDHAYDAKVKYLAGTIGEGSSGVVTSIQQNAQGRFQDLRIDVTNGVYVHPTGEVIIILLDRKQPLLQQFPINLKIMQIQSILTNSSILPELQK